MLTIIKRLESKVRELETMRDLGLIDTDKMVQDTDKLYKRIHDLTQAQYGAIL